MEQVIQLIIPFITLAILSVMIDRFMFVLQGIMHKVPHLPDQFEWTIAYIFVLAASFAVCIMGDFNLFAYLDLRFQYGEGHFLTALVLSGGSTFVKNQFMVINEIPTSIFSVNSSFIRALRPFGKKQDVPAPAPRTQQPEIQQPSKPVVKDASTQTDAKG